MTFVAAAVEKEMMRKTLFESSSSKASSYGLQHLLLSFGKYSR
jgi:hypothetical protein